jgi:hypothetical protein
MSFKVDDDDGDDATTSPPLPFISHHPRRYICNDDINISEHEMSEFFTLKAFL